MNCCQKNLGDLFVIYLFFMRDTYDQTVNLDEKFLFIKCVYTYIIIFFQIIEVRIIFPSTYDNYLNNNQNSQNLRESSQQ